MDIIKDRKPSVDPNIGFVGQLQLLEEKVASGLA